MKQRSMILAAVAMLPFAVAMAQTPPTPPTPVTPATPVTPLTPLTPLTPPTAMAPLPGRVYDKWELDEFRRVAEDAAREGRRMAEEGRWFAEDAKRIGVIAAEDARRALQDMKIDLNHSLNFDFSHFDFNYAPKAAPGAFPIPQQAPGAILYAPGQGQYRWIQGDPADSIYQLGRQEMGRYDYSRAASRFAEVIAKYPNSRRFADAVYYQAFSQFRIGTLESLRQALRAIETNQSRLNYEMRSGNDTPALQARILRALADRNESGAEAKLRDLYAKYPTTTCDTEMVSIQSQVLSSLYHSDPDAALPHIRTALAKRDACSAEIRKSAVVLLANRPTEEKAAILISVAKTDTVREVRARAIDYLSRMPGDAAINTLMELVRDDDEYVRRAAVRSLMRSDNVKARAAIKTSMIDRRDAPESQRLEAIGSFDRNNMTQEDAAFLRAVFNRRDESDRIKDRVLTVLSQVPSDENIKFLLDVAKSPNESSTLRSRALRAVTRTTLPTEELIKLYDASDARSMRQAIVEGLSNRRETAALNKLLEIVKCSTDPEVRRYTIQVLLNKNDKTVTEQVLSLMNTSGGPKC